MPIRPENRARYPKNWKSEIVPSVRKRSKDRCECDGQCGAPHDGAPDRSAAFQAKLNGRPEPVGGRCNLKNGAFNPRTGSKVVLTVAHMHGEPLESQDIERMFHACQQCHNRYDAPMRRKGILERARASLGMDDLFHATTNRGKS